MPSPDVFLPDPVLPARRRMTVALFRRMAIALAMTLFALLAGNSPALANNITARLMADGPAIPGGEVTLAIAMNPAPGWHGYWRNPGDAGFGMEFEWTVPAGVSVGEPEYPVPEALLIGPLMNHVYEGPYAILIPMRVPADAQAGSMIPVRLDAQWLACTDAICVPESGSMEVDVRVAAQGEARTQNEAFAQRRMQLPAPIAETGHFAIAGNRVRIAIPLAEGATLNQPHLFLSGNDLIRHAAPQDFSRNGNMVIVETDAADDVAAWANGAEKLDAVLRLDEEGNGLEFFLEPGTVPATGQPLAAAQDLSAFTMGQRLLLLLGAFAGGLLLNIMPCVFPILSLKALALARAGGGQQSEREARKEGLSYTAGVLVTVLLLGAVLLGLRAAGQEIGWAFQLQEPATVVLLFALAIAITANLAGLFEIGLPLPLRRHHGGAFATGALAAFAATPCTGPFMAAAMGAALLLPAIEAMAIFAALGLGLAFPFLAIGFSTRLRALLPRPGAWMARFRHAMAIPMGLTAMALAWLCWRTGGEILLAMALIGGIAIVILLAMTGRRQRSGHSARGIAAAAVAIALIGSIGAGAAPRPDKSATAIPGVVDFSEDALAKARASGQPVFLYFTADWCVTCRVNEQVAIEREATAKAFERAGVITIRGDWTRRDAAITQFLNAHGAAGVPLYLWYPRQGKAMQLQQILGPETLIELAESR